MSTRYWETIECSRCGRSHRVMLADSISVDRMPDARTWILERTLMTAVCECGLRTLIEKPLLYSDITRGWWIQLAGEARRSEFQTCEGEVRTEFADSFDTTKFPRAIAAIRDQLRVRVVFGHEELREKVLCADNGLDDALLEVLKLEVLVARPELLENGVELLVLEEVVDGVLRLVGFTTDNGNSSVVADLLVARSAHDALDQRRDELVASYPELFEGCYVNALRFRQAGLQPPPSVVGGSG